MADPDNEGSKLDGVSLRAEGRVIANFAAQHMQAAVLFRAHLDRVESEHRHLPLGEFFEDIRSYASGCALSLVACIESLINELYIAEGTLRSSLGTNFEKEFWSRTGIVWKGALEKYQIALTRLGKVKFDESHGIFRDAVLLVELRNALVHFKPTWDAPRTRAIELERDLAHKFTPSPFAGPTSDFATMRCMTVEFADWAIRTATNFIAEFASRALIEKEKLDQILSIGRRRKDISRQNDLSSGKSQWPDGRTLRWRVVGNLCHWLALACEAGGSFLIFLEARRILAQLGSLDASYSGGPPPDYGSWMYNAGELGFALLLSGIVAHSIVLVVERPSATRD